MRNKLVLLGLLIVLVLVNLKIVGKEDILSNGELVYLQLAPRDPRSLHMGDYMALNYGIARDVSSQLHEQPVVDGFIVFNLDANNVARLVRIHVAGTPLQAGEHLLQFRKRNRIVKLATDAYYFQEGNGPVFARARYGGVRVSADGEAVLVGMYDESFQKLTIDQLQ